MSPKTPPHPLYRLELECLEIYAEMMRAYAWVEAVAVGTISSIHNRIGYTTINPDL